MALRRPLFGNSGGPTKHSNSTANREGTYAIHDDVNLTPDQFSARTDPARREVFLGAFLPYVKAVQDVGIFKGGTGLEGPEHATTVRVASGVKRKIGQQAREIDFFDGACRA